MKLLQRAALQHLPPRVAAWRYQRGARSLLHNLGLGDSALGGSDGADVCETAEVDDEVCCQRRAAQIRKTQPQDGAAQQPSAVSLSSGRSAVGQQGSGAVLSGPWFPLRPAAS